jgi:type II secretory pathway pseudopilin PulG
MRRHPAHRSAFTLMEILVAVALLLALSGVLGGVLFGLSDRRELVAIEAARQGSIDILFSELDAAVVSTCVQAGKEAGLRGDATGLTVISRGVRVAPGGGAGDLVGLEIRSSTPGTISARRFSPGQPSASSLEVAATDIAGVRLRYFDGSTWSDRFDSLVTGRLPVAIEFAVWFTGNEPDTPLPSADLNAPSLRSKPGLGRLGPESDADAEDAEGRGPDAASEASWPRPSRRRVMIVPDGTAAPSSPTEVGP